MSPAMVSARRCASNVIASAGPDVCKTPVGSSVVDVAYCSMVTLERTERYTPTVRDNGKFDCQLNCAVPGVTGHEPGTLRGTVNPGYKGWGLVDIGSVFSFSMGFSNWHHRQDAWINRSDPGPQEPQKTSDSVDI
ncbi:PAAR-like domain-containing protein [Rhizobium sp. YK2]|uniref:PAAR-like domain-containing protein n=1 Tax=Rhizobium sp. YK2 TaxID=1860096 RepID=UPI00114C9191